MKIRKSILQLMKRRIGDIEDDLEYRIDDIQKLTRRLNLLIPGDEDDKPLFRKPLVLTLYSHFEGFIKGAASKYVDIICELPVVISKVNATFLAAHFNGEFNYINSGTKQTSYAREYFAQHPTLKATSHVRRTLFLNAYRTQKITRLDIRSELLVDTESNLGFDVFERILFSLAFDDKVVYFEKYKNSINALLKIRNSLAHGSRREGIRCSEYEELYKNTTDMMSDFSEIIINEIRSYF